MAVQKLRDWVTVSTASTDPDSKAIVLPSGTNRTLIFVHSVENNGDFTASCGVGLQSATGRGQLFWESGGADDLRVSYWYWDETAIAAMSATTSIQWSESVVLNGAAWSHVVLGSADGVTADTSVDTTVSSSNPMTIPTPGSSGDFTIVFGHRDTQNRQFGTDGTLTEVYDVDVGGASRGGLFDGAWSSAVETIRGTDEISDVMILAGIVVGQFTGGATITGSGSADGILPTVSADGIRIITGAPSVAAASAVTSGTLERIITGDSSASPTPILVAGSGTRSIETSVGFVAALALVSGTTLSDAIIGTYERTVKIDDRDISFRCTLHSDPYNNIAPVQDIIQKSVIIEGDFHASLVLRT